MGLTSYTSVFKGPVTAVDQLFHVTVPVTNIVERMYSEIISVAVFGYSSYLNDDKSTYFQFYEA